MPTENCRTKSVRFRKRDRQLRPDGGRDVTAQLAAERFREATGIDTGNDAELRAIMSVVRQGCQENARPARERLEARDGSHDVVWLPTQTTRGAQALPKNLVWGLGALVEHVGSASNAAVAVMLFGLHRHPGFPRGPTPEDEAFDVERERRLLAQRISHVTRRERIRVAGSEGEET